MPKTTLEEKKIASQAAFEELARTSKEISSFPGLTQEQKRKILSRLTETFPFVHFYPEVKDLIIS